LKDQPIGPQQQEDVLACIVLAVAAVDVFMNVFFRYLVTLAQFSEHESSIRQDLNQHMGLEKRLRQWPEKVLGARIDFGQGIGQKFDSLRNLRNDLMHFSYEPTDIDLGAFEIRGIAYLDVFNDLSVSDASSALATAEGMVAELLRMWCSVDSSPCKDAPFDVLLWHWTGRPKPGG
jgi:hypothetical protein